MSQRAHNVRSGTPRACVSVRNLPLLICVLLLPFHVARADEKPGHRAPLAGLPSSPGPHVAKIKALENDQWLALGTPEPDPKWGPAPGRAYTNKMAYAPDLVGAFLQGEGVHGAHGSGPREGRYNDDVFFYDLMAHRYICLYPGTKTDSFQVKLDEEGFVAAEDGQHLPIAIAVHGYECSSYNPKTRQFMTLLTGSPYSRTLRSRLKTMVQDPSLHSRDGGGKHPFFYDVDSGRWFRRKVEGNGPRTGFADALIYLPRLQKTALYQRGSDFWLFDHDRPSWQRVTAKGGAPETADGRRSSEGTVCYDSKRELLYVFNRDQVSMPWAYDPKTNTFRGLKAKNQFYPPTNSYEQGRIMIGSTSSGVHYDSAADVVVMRLRIKRGTGDPRNIPAETLGLAIYDPVTNEWQQDIVPLPEAAQIRGAWNSFYSPELNVHVYHIARDSRTGGTVVVYRHRRRDELVGDEQPRPSSATAVERTAVVCDSPGRSCELAEALRPGDWLDITAEMKGFDRELWRGPQGGRSILNFGARAAWDPGTKRLLFLSTGGPRDTKRFLTYSGVTHRWKVMPDPPWFKTHASPGGHRLNACAVDPGRSLFYYQSASGTIHRYDIRQAAWSELPAVADAPTDAAGALVYFLERDSLVGFFREEVYAWSEKDHAWTMVGRCPTRANIHFAEYNPVHKFVFFGRVRGAPLYRLDRNGAITPLKDAPVRMSFGTAHIRADTIGGDFVVPYRRAGNERVLLTYDIEKDQWAEKKGATVPEELFERAMSVSIPESGVLLFVTQTKVFLYKHSRSGE